MSTADHPRVLLGVTGGIAAYKSPDIVRRLLDRGADVQVVMTPSAERLVSPTVFQAVSGRAVRGELWDEQAEAAMGHIELARWADRILIAPATAHVMSQLATGAAGSGASEWRHSASALFETFANSARATWPIVKRALMSTTDRSPSAVRNMSTPAGPR